MENCPHCGEEYYGYRRHILGRHPISCKEVQDKLSDYVFHKLDELTEERITCHINNCYTCMDVLSKSSFNEAQMRKAEATS